MPVIPRSLSKGLIERVRTRLEKEVGKVERGVERVVERALGIETTRPEDRGPTEFEKYLPQAPDPKVVPYYLWITMLDTKRPDWPEVLRRASFAGKYRLVVKCTYNDHTRDMEPQCLRYWDKDNADIPLLYAYCQKDRQIEAFKLKKFTMMQLTNRFYSERGYPIEF